MKLRHRGIRNDPEICRMITEIVGGPEGARRELENVLGKDLTQQVLGGKGLPKRARRARRS